MGQHRAPSRLGSRLMMAALAVAWSGAAFCCWLLYRAFIRH